MFNEELLNESMFLNEQQAPPKFLVNYTKLLLSRPTILLASFKKDIARLNRMVKKAKTVKELDNVIRIVDLSKKQINASKKEKLSINAIPVVEKKAKEKIISAYIKDLDEVKKSAIAKKKTLK